MKKKPNPELTDDINQILEEIGSRIRVKRKLMVKNYEDFARDHNFNKITILRIENGENVTIRKLITVARAVGITPEDLFNGIR